MTEIARRLASYVAYGSESLVAMSDMAYRQLGSSGLNVSVVGIGCNNFGFRIDEEASAAVVSAASKPASTCSTPRRATARVRSGSARPSSVTATRW